MPRMGFEPTIPVLEQAKIFHLGTVTINCIKQPDINSSLYACGNLPLNLTYESSQSEAVKFPQSCSLATAVVLSSVYTAVKWKRVYMSQYVIFTIYYYDDQINECEMLIK
jgi:hypothetical protein